MPDVFQRIIRWIRAWGRNAESLIDPLLEALQLLPIDQRPEIKRTKASGAYATTQSSAVVDLRLLSAAQVKLEDLIFARDPFMKDEFVTSDTASRKAVVRRVLADYDSVGDVAHNDINGIWLT